MDKSNQDGVIKIKADGVEGWGRPVICHRNWKNHEKKKIGLDAKEKFKLQVSYSHTITDKI